MARITIKTVSGQTIWDVATQYYGTRGAAGQVYRDNPDRVNFRNAIPADTELLIDTDKVVDRKVVAFFQQENVLPPVTAFVNVTNWILADGTWNNSGVWVNNEIWLNTN